MADRAIDARFDRIIDADLRVFIYMPFEHSEDIADQHRAVVRCHGLVDASFMKYAELHRDLIARFGRFSHRKTALGRESTDEEQASLAAGDFSV